MRGAAMSRDLLWPGPRHPSGSVGDPLLVDTDFPGYHVEAGLKFVQLRLDVRPVSVEQHQPLILVPRTGTHEFGEGAQGLRSGGIL